MNWFPIEIQVKDDHVKYNISWENQNHRSIGGILFYYPIRKFYPIFLKATLFKPSKYADTGWENKDFQILLASLQIPGFPFILIHSLICHDQQLLNSLIPGCIAGKSLCY